MLLVVAPLLAGCHSVVNGTYTAGGPSAAPIPASPLTASPTAGGATPIELPADLLLAVPYTTQAPLNDWSAHQNSCEEAALTMVDRYLKGEREYVIGGQAAEQEINSLTSWQLKNWGAERDLSLGLVGQLANRYFGYSYLVLPATEQSIEQQLALGRPVLLPVMTHGLLNPDYPGYSSHYEQPGWSVYHIIVLVGYKAGGVIVNDAGISAGRRIFYTWHQVFHGVDDVQVRDPQLYEGHQMLVVAQPAH